MGSFMRKRLVAGAVGIATIAVATTVLIRYKQQEEQTPGHAPPVATSTVPKPVIEEAPIVISSSKDYLTHGAALEREGKIADALTTYMDNREDPKAHARAKLMANILIREGNGVAYAPVYTLIKEEVEQKIDGITSETKGDVRTALLNTVAALERSAKFVGPGEPPDLGDDVKDAHLALVNKVASLRKLIRRGDLAENVGKISHEIADVAVELFCIARSDEIALVHKSVYTAVSDAPVVKEVLGNLFDPRFGTTEESRSAQYTKAQDAESKGDLETAAYSYYNAGHIGKAYSLLLKIADQTQEHVSLAGADAALTDKNEKARLIESYAQRLANGELNSALTLYKFRETGLVPPEFAPLIVLLEKAIPLAAEKLDSAVSTFIEDNGLGTLYRDVKAPRDVPEDTAVAGVVVRMSPALRTACDYIRARGTQSFEDTYDRFTDITERYVRLNTNTALSRTAFTMAELLEEAYDMGECSDGTTRRPALRQFARRGVPIRPTQPRGIDLNPGIAQFDAEKDSYARKVTPIISDTLAPISERFQSMVNYCDGVMVEVSLDPSNKINGNVVPASVALTSMNGKSIPGPLADEIKSALTAISFEEPPGVGARITYTIPATGTTNFLQNIFYSLQ